MLLIQVKKNVHKGNFSNVLYIAFYYDILRGFLFVSQNGANMGFSIVSILAAISAVSVMSITVIGNNSCGDYYQGLKMSDGIDRCPKVIQTRTAINNTALAISVALLGLSVLNLVLCSIRCCCNKVSHLTTQFHL